MGNEVSAQRVTFSSRPPFKQVQQEASSNSHTPPTNKRKREEFEEGPLIQNYNKRRRLNQNEHSSHSVLTSRSLIVILKCDSLSSLQSVCQYREPERTEKYGASNKEAEISDAVLSRLVRQRIDHMNKQKQKDRRLRKQWAKTMARKPGRDPIGTPFLVRLRANTSNIPSTVSEPTAAGTNKDAEIKESPRITMKFRLKASPNTTASTSSAAESKDQLIVKLKMPKEFFSQT